MADSNDELIKALDEIRRSAFVSGHTKKSYKDANPQEAGRVFAYLDGGPEPSPLPTTLMGSGLTRLGKLRSPRKPSPWPASYFTGPLGQNNVLPADTSGALFGAYIGDSNVASTAAQQRVVVTDRIAALTRVPDVMPCHEGTYTASGVVSIDWIHSLGSIPVVIGGFSATSYLWEGESSDVGWTWAQIAAGTPAADASIDALAARLTRSFRVMYDPAREFNGSQTKIDTDPEQADFRAAWQRMVDRFQAAGATNVGFMWTPTEQGSVANRAGIDACYPGDAYVDWICSDKYNHSKVGVFDTPYHSGWATHNEMLNYAPNGTTIGLSMANTWGQIKPYIQAETGCRYDSATPTRKGDWHRAVDTETKVNMGTNLCGVIYFDQQFLEAGGWQDWRVDSTMTSADRDANTAAPPGSPGGTSADAFDGWKDLALSTRFSVGATGGAT